MSKYTQQIISYFTNTINFLKIPLLTKTIFCFNNLKWIKISEHLSLKCYSNTSICIGALMKKIFYAIIYIYILTNNKQYINLHVAWNAQ